MNVRVNLIYGACYGDPPTIIINHILGGAGVQNDYYVNFYKKDNPNNCYTVGTIPIPVPCSFPQGTTRKLTVIFSTSNLSLTTHIEFGYGVSYGKPTSYQVRMADFINGITGFGRQFVITNNKLEIYITPSDPLYSTLTVSTLQENLPEPYSHVQLADDCPISTSNTKNICGWQPIAGGIGMFQYTLPNQSDIYLVEVTDQHFTTSFVTVEVVITPPPACIIKTKDSSYFGANDGELDVVVPSTGGPFTFNWYDSNNALISFQKKVVNVAPGTYCLDLINYNGCIINCCAIILEPLQMVPTIVTKKDYTCDNIPTKIRILMEGGIRGCENKCDDQGNYEYSFDKKIWYKSVYGDLIEIKGLPVGKYLLYIKDCACNIIELEFEILDLTIKVNL